MKKKKTRTFFKTTCETRFCSMADSVGHDQAALKVRSNHGSTLSCPLGAESAGQDQTEPKVQSNHRSASSKPPGF